MTPSALLARRRTNDLAAEDGQAVVEFALVLFPLLIIVTGIIHIGIAVSFWQDQERLAAAGARVAVVNCAAATWCTPTLARFLEGQPLSRGNVPDAKVCFLSKSGSGGTQALAGDAIRVQLTSPYHLVPLLGVGTIHITAETTMRLEQNATHVGISSEEQCT